MAEKKSSGTDESRKNPADEVGADEVQAKSDEAAEKGFIGERVDETPLENYTLEGVTSGKPTPETERGKQ